MPSSCTSCQATIILSLKKWKIISDWNVCLTMSVRDDDELKYVQKSFRHSRRCDYLSSSDVSYFFLPQESSAATHKCWDASAHPAQMLWLPTQIQILWSLKPPRCCEVSNHLDAVKYQTTSMLWSINPPRCCEGLLLIPNKKMSESEHNHLAHM